MRRFELTEGTSSKFWEVVADGEDLTVRFGRIGTAGQTKTKSFASAAAAEKERDKLIKEKTGKGYAEVAVGDGATLAPAPKPAQPEPVAAPEAAAAPVPQPAAPAPARQAPPAPAAATAVPAAVALPTTIEWPTGGFQWLDEWRAAIPVVRGIVAAPPPAPALSLLSDPLQLSDDKHGYKSHQFNEFVKAAGRSWTPWSRADSKERITRARLREADFEYWLELCVQACCEYDRRDAVSWVARVGIALHGVPFIMDVAVSLWEMSSHYRITHAITDQLFGALRAAIASADDARHAEALEAATRLRERSPAARLACAHLFPHVEAWAVECIEQGIEDPGLLLKECVMPAPLALQYVRNTSGYLYYLQPLVLLQLHLHGEEAFDLLAWLVRKSGGTADALKLLTHMRVPRLVGELVAGIENRDIRGALEKLAEEFPAAVLKTAIEHTLATRSRTVEGWVVRLALRKQAALPSAMAALDDGSRARFQQILDALQCEDAPLEQVPELLRDPPWLRKARAQELPTLALERLPLADTLQWSAAQNEQYAKYEPNDWYLNRKPAKVKAETHLLSELCIAEAAHARVLEGGALQPDDIVKRPYFYGAYIDLALLLPPAASLAVWNSYPAQLWNVWGEPERPVMALMARHGLAALPGLVGFVQAYPEQGYALALQVDSPALAPAAMHALRNLKKAKANALQWIQAHLRATIVAALPLAFGKDRAARDNAQHALRWLAQNGHEAAVREVAAEYGGPVPAALQALLDADPLLVLPSRMPKLPTFFVPASFRRPELRSGGALPVSALEHIGTMLMISKLDAPYAGLDMLRAACTPASLGEFAWDVFEAWTTAGSPSKEGWAFTALGLIGDDETARRLAPRIREWPGESAHARAVTGLDLLAAIGTDVALMHLNGIAGKVKFKALQERAKEKIAAVAEARGFTAEELADRLVPDLGLDEHGTLELDFGPRRFCVAFDEALKPYVKDAQGVRLKDLPKPVKSDDAALAAAAVERYKQIKKDAKAIASLQLMRLEQGMVARRRWSAGDFRLFFLEHPLMRHLAAKVVWGVYVDGQLRCGFRVAEDWTLADENDSLYELPDDASVGITHVLEMPQPMQAAFGQIFADYEILQPFKQLGRETYTLTDAEKQLSAIDRYKDKVVATGSVMGLVNRGWERGQAQDAGWVGEFSKRVGDGLQVDLQIDPGTVVGDLSYEPKQKLPSLSLRRANTWDDTGLVKFSALDPILASEVLRDVELLAPMKDE